METILHKIVERIREDEAGNFCAFSLDRYALRARPRPISILTRLEEGFCLIAEVKRGSPSKGIIRPNYFPPEIAEGYQRAGASAVSVITESNFFYGRKEHLKEVRRAVSLPLLRKDFIVHPFQVYESFNLGADFILLIAACLSGRLLRELYCHALSLGMEALVEVHTQEELERVLGMTPMPRVIGINNRDLKTFKVDLNTSFQLKKLIPPDIFVISESGIKTPAHVQSLRAEGFAGALVGESLLREEKPSDALRNLLGAA